MKRLGILGTLVLDTIRAPGSRESVRAPGGLAYVLSAFELARPAGWTALPIVKVGRDARTELAAVLDALESVGGREGVRVVPDPNDRVELVYREDGSRTERPEGGVPGWSWDELEPLARTCDALYVNLIAGREVDLASARRLRATVGGPVYCDLHSLLLEAGEEGVRRPRAPDDWRAWTGCFDYLQLNEEELTILAQEEGEEPWTLAESLVGEAPRILFVTLGPRGAAWLAARPSVTDGAPAGARAPERGRLPVPPEEAVAPEPTDPAAGRDATGCGDVWGVTCFSAVLDGAGPARAVAAANRMAARNARLRGGTALLEAGGPGRKGAGRGAEGGG